MDIDENRDRVDTGQGSPRVDTSLSTPLSIRDAADLVGVTEKTIRRWIHRGWLQAEKVGGQYRIDHGSVEQARLGTRPEAVSTPVSRHETVPMSTVQIERVDTGQQAMSTGVDIRPLVDHIASLEGKVQELTEAATLWQFRARHLEEQIKQLTAGDVAPDHTSQDQRTASPEAPGATDPPAMTPNTSHEPSHVAGWLRKLFGRR